MAEPGGGEHPRSEGSGLRRGMIWAGACGGAGWYGICPYITTMEAFFFLRMLTRGHRVFQEELPNEDPALPPTFDDPSTYSLATVPDIWLARWENGLIRLLRSFTDLNLGLWRGVGIVEGVDRRRLSSKSLELEIEMAQGFAASIDWMGASLPRAVPSHLCSNLLWAIT